MRNLFITFIIVVFTSGLYAQDLIVTNVGDSLNCKISEIKDGNLYFTFKHKDGVKSSLIPISNTSSCKCNYYKEGIAPLTEIFYSPDFSHFRFGLNAGFSQRTGSIDSKITGSTRTLIEGIRTGPHLSFDGTYYSTENCGLGLLLFATNAYNSMEHFSNNESIKTSVTMSIISPFISLRFYNSTKKNIFTTNLGMGYKWYYESTFLNNSHQISKGNSFSYFVSLGYDRAISRNVLFGCQISFIKATLENFESGSENSSKTLYLTETDYMNLNHLDFSIGFRFQTDK